MSENILKQLTKINMLNIIIGAIVIVWVFATIKSIVTNQEMTVDAKATIDSLRSIMLMVLGYYLKSDKIKSETEI